MGTPLSHSIMAAVSKKRKFVADGVFYAELNDMLTAELADDGYAGVNVRVTPSRTEIIIKATQTQNVLGERGRRIRELTAVVQQRFNFPDGGIELYAQWSRTVVSAPLPRPSRSATSSPVASPSAALATVSSASSWRLAPRAARSSSLASSVLPVPRP